VAGFNLACALARAGDARSALRPLGDLPATAALRAKVMEDADLETVRALPAYPSFLKGLPKR